MSESLDERARRRAELYPRLVAALHLAVGEAIRLDKTLIAAQIAAGSPPWLARDVLGKLKWYGECLAVLDEARRIDPDNTVQ